MNYVELEYLNDGLVNPETRKEEAMTLRIKELEDSLERVEYLATFEEGRGLEVEDSEAGTIFGDLPASQSDIFMVRKILREVLPEAQKIQDEWFETEDDMPEKGSLEWFAVTLAGLEADDECLADSALSMAYQAMGKLSDVIEDLGCY